MDSSLQPSVFKIHLPFYLLDHTCCISSSRRLYFSSRESYILGNHTFYLSFQMYEHKVRTLLSYYSPLPLGWLTFSFLSMLSLF